MYRKIQGIALCLLFAMPLRMGWCENKVTRYEIDIPENLIEASGGFAPGIGSGLEFSRQLPNEDLEFFLATDRGPNCAIDGKEGKDDPLAVLYPEFTPKIARVIIKKDTLQHGFVEDYIDIDRAINVSSESSTTMPLIVDKFLQPITTPICIDVESIAILDEDTFIVGDEYGPSIYFIDRRTGQSKRVLKPGDGLPNIFKDRSANRGIEALTVAPNGKIYAALEGTLDIDGKTQRSAQLIRFVEIDPRTNAMRSFAYKIDCDMYRDSSAVKIGDMDAIDNENFIIIEQGKSKDGIMQNLIYKINIADAIDISNIKLQNGGELECTSDSKKLVHINFIQKKLLLNPRDYGWNYQKIEGLAFIDNHRLAITNDNDFGILRCTKEQYPCNDGSKKDNCYRVVPTINEESKKTNLWIFELENSIQ